jgi:outer membrane protein assembly factor BamB
MLAPSPAPRLASAALALTAAFALVTRCAALDWPCFRGPNHNGISRETGFASAFPAGGPTVLWRASIGLGFSTMVVADGCVIATGHKAGKDTVWCLDAEKGAVLWSHSYAAPLGDKFFEGGATGTPTIHDGKVFHLSREGDFFCFDLKIGKILRQNQLAKELGVTVPDWGFASSALIEGDLMLLNVGGTGTAFDWRSGKIIWTSGKEMAAYATAVPFDLEGLRCAAIFTHRECVAVEVASGKILWRQKFVSNYDTNAGAPVIHRGRLLLSAYNVPAVALNLADGTPASGWSTTTRIHFNAGVTIGDSLYAFHGQAGKPDGELRCLDWQTGATRWAQKGLGVGSLMAADGRLIILSEKGELILAEISPVAFKPLARAQVLGGKCWAVPVLANGRIYCRNSTGDLVCVDVRATPSAK